MKHGKSPTTDRRALKRRGKYIHVSKPLALLHTDSKGEDEQYASIDTALPPGRLARVVMAPVKGITYRKAIDAVSSKGRGKRRRSGKRVTAQ